MDPMATKTSCDNKTTPQPDCYLTTTGEDHLRFSNLRSGKEFASKGQPLGEALVQQPVNFMTNTPQLFTTVIVVLGVPITIHLTPVFEWEFGDGNTLTTKLPGAPYPLALIQNTYTNSGEKNVVLTTRWSGFWRAGALGAPINGAITQKVQKRILVRPGAITYRP